MRAHRLERSLWNYVKRDRAFAEQLSCAAAGLNLLEEFQRHIQLRLHLQHPVFQLSNAMILILVRLDERVPELLHLAAQLNNFLGYAPNTLNRFQ